MIGVVTTSYPRFADDGAGGFVRERVRALVALGEEVEVVAAGTVGSTDGAAVTRIPAGDLFYTGGAPEAFEAERFSDRLLAYSQAVGFSVRMLAELARRQGRWRKVESHWIVPCALAAASALPGLPHRAHIHGGDLHLLERLPCADSLARVLCRQRPELIFASAQLCARFTTLLGAPPESLGARCRVEAAPFDPSLFQPRTPDEVALARAHLGLAGAPVLGAGRLQPIKGFDVLITAVGRLPRNSRPPLVIAGEGPERPRLVRLARVAQVDLHLPGVLGQRALAEHMAAAALFVHPCRTLPGGRSEGTPVVVREALARGLPVIASASGGLAELRGASGLTLVSEGDDHALADAIARALG